MVKAPQQALVADAAASPPAMQDGAAQTAADQTNDDQGAGQQSPATAAQHITRSHLHTASSTNAQPQLPTIDPKEQNPGHQSAIRRVKSKESTIRDTPPKSQNISGSKPVLVHGPSTKPDMKKKHQPVDKSTSPKLPPVESFSFQDILGTLGPEANASIDAIAEICGRSKMSLAAEHSSHRPPQGQLSTTGSSPDNFFLPGRLEPVAETSSERPHTRSTSRSLALATGAAQNGTGLPGTPTAATSNVLSHTHTCSSGRGRDGGSSTTTSVSLLPQVLAWLRHSSSTTNEQTSASGQDAGAASVMHRLLNDTPDAQL